MERFIFIRSRNEPFQLLSSGVDNLLHFFCRILPNGSAGRMVSNIIMLLLMENFIYVINFIVKIIMFY